MIDCGLEIIYDEVVVLHSRGGEGMTMMNDERKNYYNDDSQYH